jgi:hypothetical protein
MSRQGAFPPIAGLGAAALIAWLACPAPPRRMFTLDRALLAGMVYLTSVAAACAISALLAQRKRPQQRAGIVLGLTACAIWFAPAAIFFYSRSSPLSSAAGGLIATAALLIAACVWWLDRPPSPPDLAFASGMFSLPYSIRLMRQLPVSTGVALLAQLIAMLVISGNLVPAFLLALATAAVFWRTRNWGQQEDKLTAVTAAIAVMLTIVGLFQFLTFGGASATAGEGRGENDSRSNPPPPAASDTGDGIGEFTGVILIPDVEKHVTLVPPLPMMRSEVFRKTDDNPLTIPFFGVYWFYRFPATRPPPNSVTLHGKPEDIRFRSMGHVALRMEAHQNLGKLIDVSCCSGIQVAIHNAEHIRSTGDPRGIGRIQLILANTTPRSGAPESLGMEWIDGSEYQVLDFRMRSSVELLQFDELTVRILPEWIATPQSARISVERFVLIPRGR